VEADAQKLSVVELTASPLAPGVSPVRIRYREYGRGAPLLFLHGGWGYEVYPFDRQIAALASHWHIVIPDRSGYGGSSPIADLDPGFHLAAAGETLALADTLKLERVAVWGHSDGAVIAALIGLCAPHRVSRLIFEAMHLYPHKPSSRDFFALTAEDPDSVGDRVAAVLARDHGSGWRRVIARHSEAWLRLDAEQPAGADFYGGRLQDLRVPALLVHGARDPRTEPGELEAVSSQLAHAERQVLADGGHSPHSERATGDTVSRIARRFLG
jgi:pimeloyl-ACP methyl ester carboxylesterase